MPLGARSPGLPKPAQPTSRIEVPSKATLAKYGLNEGQWRAILVRQKFVCAVCQKSPSKGRLCIDHEHVKGWKKMPAEQRRLYVRGLLCWFCNHYYLSRAITIAKAENVVAYLKAYEERHPGKKRVDKLIAALEDDQ